MPDEYQAVLVTHPNPAMSAVQDADLVVVNHGDGMWSVLKDRYGDALTKRPWDSLPSRIKRAVTP